MEKYLNIIDLIALTIVLSFFKANALIFITLAVLLFATALLVVHIAK